ncbi:MAG: hypothetical protein Q4F30_07025, partial [Akkermansia sp.]|nr:hypothetical protein [Akkermansia sp.]
EFDYTKIRSPGINQRFPNMKNILFILVCTVACVHAAKAELAYNENGLLGPILTIDDTDTVSTH